MALPLEMTLGELRQDVLARLGMVSAGTTSKTLKPVVDATLNAAQALISVRAVWARRLKDVVIPLVQAQRDYDIPDESDGLGGLQRLDITNQSGTRYPLQYDDSLDIESSTDRVNSPGRPIFWQIVDDVIRLDRVVDAVEYPTLTVRILPRPIRLVEDENRCIVDSEALVQLATIKMKEYLGTGGDTKTARAEFERYLVDIRSTKSGPPKAFDIASRRLMGPAYWDWSAGLNSQPYSPSWNPGGNW